MDSTSIVCDATECVHNDNKKCTKDCITLETNGEYLQPECTDYQDRDFLEMK
jgi:hypothetical protein